ncbi:hypothetical protein GCM10011518_33670 [Flavobacterium limi]|uniref:Uncharacterized protein n=1 Tax=Flavobacterium limi TaxID=2045105 RepID=A0ABQ1UNW3_9FLAO|nr:hypothetical protein GCM10011518_33670 [Flavobacterium limi]
MKSHKLSVRQAYTQRIYLIKTVVNQIFDFKDNVSVMSGIISWLFGFQFNQYVLIFNAKLQLLK